MTVALTGRLVCVNADEAAVVQRFLADHIRLTRAEPGCLRFDVVQTSDALVWQVDEAFVDRAAFDAHQARTATSPWAGATAGIRRDFRITGA